MVELTVSETETGKRFDLFLCEKFPQLTRSAIQKLMQEGNALLNGKTVKAGEKLRAGDVIRFHWDESKELDAKAEDIDFEIIYEDDCLAVINKPQGLVVHPCATCKEHTLVNGLLHRLTDLSGINGILRPGIVHRIDKNTSGLLVVAKNDIAHHSLAKQIQDKTCRRTYLALVTGTPKSAEGTVQTFLTRDKKDRKKYAVSATEGKKAITHYQVKEVYSGYSLVEFRLETGRTHQIRVHAKHLGHPVAGDDLYGKPVKIGGILPNGQLLHAAHLEFVHPKTGESLHFSAPLPPYFNQILMKLGTKN